MEKTIKVYLDDNPVEKLIITEKTDIRSIKTYLKKYKNVISKFYIDKHTEMPVFNTDKYDNTTLKSIFDKLESSFIILKTIRKTNFTGNKDVDYIIMQNLDDASLIKFCQVNLYIKSLCENDIFWKNRLESKFGSDVLNIKKKEKTWRNFYIKIIYYQSISKNINVAMKLSARDKNEDLVNFFISQGADDWEMGLEGASEGGDLKLVDFFISQGTTNWNKGLWGASKGGHIDLVDFFITEGAGAINHAIKIASTAERMSMITHLLNMGADPEQGFLGAAKGGHRYLVEFFISKGVKGKKMWCYGLTEAAKGGHKDLVDFFISKGGDCWRDASSAAEIGGHPELAKYLKNIENVKKRKK